MKNAMKTACMQLPFLLALQMAPPPAQARLEVCNRIGTSMHHRGGDPYAQTIDVAVAYYDIDDDRTNSYHQTGTKTWITEGWFRIPARSCETVYPHELRRRNTIYYVHVRGRSDGATHSFCVDNYDRFKLGSADRVCQGGRGRRPAGFFEVNTGSNRDYTYTVN